MRRSKWIPEYKALPPVLIDRSALEKYSVCPFQADAIRNGLVQDTNRAAQIGIEAHRIIAEAMESCHEEPDMLVEWIQAESQKARPDIQPDVISSLRGIANILRGISTDRIVSIEKQYSTEFLPGNESRGPVILTTCMDLILAGKDETVLHDHDWKTGWKQRTSEDAKTEFQTCFHCWILWKAFPNLSTIHFWYENTRLGSRAYACLEREKDFYNFEGRIQSVLKYYLVNNMDVWPEPDKCSLCPATSLCKYANEESVDINKNPGLYLDHAVTAQARADKMVQTMKAYCKEHVEIRSERNWFGDERPKPRVNYKVKSIQKEDDDE